VPDEVPGEVLESLRHLRAVLAEDLAAYGKLPAEEYLMIAGRVAGAVQDRQA